MIIDKNLNGNLPLVTIITPSFNQGKFIRETIESVLNQNYPNIEYWVIDGGSTDETISILKSYEGKLNWISEKDDGQADAVNKGINLAKGSIIGWLNSDDIYTEGAINHVVNFMNKHPETDMVYGEGYFIDKNSKIIDRYNTERFNAKRLSETCIICQPAAFFTNYIVKQVGLLDKNLNLCMDYELWIKIAQNGCIRYTSKYLAASRMYNENKTLSRKLEVNEEVCYTLNKYYGYVPLIWVYGYSLHLNNEKRNIYLLLLMVKYYLKFDIKYLTRIIREFRILLSHKEKYINRFSGKYYDGWLSDKYKCNKKLKNPSNKILLLGNHIWPINKNLEIMIYIDGVIKGITFLDEIGEFHKEIILEEFICSGTHTLELMMDFTYCPNDLHIIADKRKLTFKLYTLDFII